jgi:hypothetical protein
VSWADLTPRDRRIVRAFLDHVPVGAAISRDAAVALWPKHHEYELWLFRAANAFADQTDGVYPVDYDHPAWLCGFKQGLSPLVVAKNVLRLLPLVRIVDDRLVCPVCGIEDAIVEIDESVRENELTVQNGAIFGSTGDYSFEPTGCRCAGCQTDVQLPGRVEDYS